jgi:hypothetical protein
MPTRGGGMSLSSTVRASVVGLDVPTDRELRKEDVERVLGPSDYPTAAGWNLSDPPRAGLTDGGAATPVMLEWEIVGHTVLDRDRGVQEIAPQYRCHGEHWLIPAVGSARNRLTPIILWWSLLYAPSMFARYEPVEWQRCLDVNLCELAMPLELALDVAMAAIPQLVHGALLGDEHLLPPR